MGILEVFVCHISECSADSRATLQHGRRAPGDCVHVCMNMSFNSIDCMHMSFTIQKDIYMSINTIESPVHENGVVIPKSFSGAGPRYIPGCS